MITYHTFAQTLLPTINENDGHKGAISLLQLAYDMYEDELIYACSFGVEGMVLIDLISKIKKDARIVFLDTNVHFSQTYELIEKIQKRYPEIQLTLKQPSLTLEEQAKLYGDELWKSNPNLCCQIRKVEPLKEVLTDIPAWITGLRREQSETRKNADFISVDNKFKNIKICPLIHWTWKDVWKYVFDHSLDYNPLHDQGYPSIGCLHCTSPSTGTDLRSGRWGNSKKTECGLHE